MTGEDILKLNNGDSIQCTEFYKLIVDSKNRSSSSWAGEEYIIKNTPQQGINWIGNDSCPKAVIIKSNGKYDQDDHGKRYAFKARKGYVNKEEKANRVIINQKEYNYPLLYFVKRNNYYELFGRYSVDKVLEKEVTLRLFSETEQEKSTEASKTLNHTILIKSKEKNDENVKYVTGQKIFTHERDLQNCIINNLSQLFPGYTIFGYKDEGKEYFIEGKRIDILLENKQSDEMLVLELKAGLANRDAFGQISSYLGMLIEKYPAKKIKGIIIAGDVDNSLQKACSTNSNISIMIYKINIELEKL